MYNKITKINAKKLSVEEVKKALIGGWKLQDTTIIKTYKFKNFEDTWGFLTKVSMRSHLAGHHPTIINTYNIVEIKLRTHDIDGLSDVDVKLANRFDQYFEKMK